MVWDGSRPALLSAAAVGIPSERASAIAACCAAFNGEILLKLGWDEGCVLPTGSYLVFVGLLLKCCKVVCASLSLDLQGALKFLAVPCDHVTARVSL